MTARFIRVCGEALDADQITPRCADCGLSEYSCECEVEEWPKVTMTMAEVEAQIARVFGGLDPKPNEDGSWSVAA